MIDLLRPYSIKPLFGTTVERTAFSWGSVERGMPWKMWRSMREEREERCE